MFNGTWISLCSHVLIATQKIESTSTVNRSLLIWSNTFSEFSSFALFARILTVYPPIEPEFGHGFSVVRVAKSLFFL